MAIVGGMELKLLKCHRKKHVEQRGKMKYKNL